MSSHITRTYLPKGDNEIACCAISISTSSCVERRSCRSILRTTVYLNWLIADTGNGTRLCCFGEVAWVKNAFCKHVIQLDLVVGVGEDDFLRWSQHIGCQFIDAT